MPAREDHPLIARFDSVGEAYLRASWLPGDATVGAKHGRLVVSLGGRVALADLEPDNLIDREASVTAGTTVWRWQPLDLVQGLREIGFSGEGLTATWAGPASATRTTVEVQPGRIRIGRLRLIEVVQSGRRRMQW